MQHQLLTSSNLYDVLKKRFPQQNDFSEGDYKEELEELNVFGIKTIEALDKLIDRQMKSVMQIDSDPLDSEHIKWYSDWYGHVYVQERVKNNYWFAFPGLLRIMLELEFGDAYRTFAQKRDGHI
jgi:hypothetical protein